MSIVTTFVGLDYHDDSIQVCVMNSEGIELVNRSVANDVELVGELIWKYGVPQSVAIEACSGAADYHRGSATDRTVRREMEELEATTRFSGQAEERSDRRGGQSLDPLALSPDQERSGGCVAVGHCTLGEPITLEENPL